MATSDKAVEILRVSGQAKARQAGCRTFRRQRPGGLHRRRSAPARRRDRLLSPRIRLSRSLADDAVKARGREQGRHRCRCQRSNLLRARLSARPSRNCAIKIGEKLEVSAAAYFDGQTAVYLHRRASDLPPQVGVLVEYEGSDASAARSVAMQIAAMRPQYVSRDEVPRELVENERRIAEATAKEEGKPEQALPKIVEGRLNAYFKDVALLDQPSVTDNKMPGWQAARRGR